MFVCLVKNIFFYVVVVVLIISVASNIYTFTNNKQSQQAAGSVTLNLIGHSPFDLSSVAKLFVAIRTLNGTALVTGFVNASAPINFRISYLGPDGPYAYQAINATRINVRVLLPQGTWAFTFEYAGVDSLIYVASFTLNYSYLTWPP
jgi:hypothetical protein